MNKEIPLIYEGFDLIKYSVFLSDCLTKDYTNHGTHKHHMMPRFMGGSDNKQNLIVLNYEDHYKSHIILAECFPIGNVNRGKNYASALLVLGHVKGYLSKKYGDNVNEHLPNFWEVANNEVKVLCSGENNPNFGIKLSPEDCKMMSDQRKGTRMGSDNHFFGKTHSEESRDKIRKYRATQVFSEDARKRQIAALIKNIKYGSENRNYGKTWEEIYGEDRAKELKIAFSKRTKDRFNILPDGIFECDVEINGIRKRYYRQCPNDNCDNLIYYVCNRDRGPILNAHRSNRLCKSCAAILRSKNIDLTHNI